MRRTRATQWLPRMCIGIAIIGDVKYGFVWSFLEYLELWSCKKYFLAA